jgi:hypothetical protein
MAVEYFCFGAQRSAFSMMAVKWTRAYPVKRVFASASFV